VKAPLESVLTVPVRRPARRRGRAYSRFVHLTKWLLPAIAIALLLLVAAWPRLQLALEFVHISLPRIDLSEARDLRMTDARYNGVDKQNRPFVVTARVARQTPQTNDLVSLEGPKADLTRDSGGWLRLTANSGIYQPESQLLDLFGNVVLTQDRGDEFRSATARIDMGGGSAQGKDPVEGDGPFGHVTAEGFHILNRGETIIFTGRAQLTLNPHGGATP
jgi:lipopolysaccharide export system protein LptC